MITSLAIGDMQEKRKEAPRAVVRRLTQYLTRVKILLADGVKWISSERLGRMLGLTSSTVRQDLSYIDFSGISRRGYETIKLEKVLQETFASATDWKVIIVGAGNFGKALVYYNEFAKDGFRICGLFDVDPKKYNKKVGRLAIRPMESLAEYISENDIDFGIIAVPASSAQGVADILRMCGIKGILNLSATHLVLPEKVPLVDVRIGASLQELAYHVKTNRNEGLKTRKGK